MGRLYRLTTTTVTVVKNLLKLLACQIREILESLLSSDAILQAPSRAIKPPALEEAGATLCCPCMWTRRVWRRLLSQQVVLLCRERSFREECLLTNTSHVAYKTYSSHSSSPSSSWPHPLGSDWSF